MTTTAVAPSEVGVKVGDFFYASWGYEQTNIDFFKVVGLTPKGVKIQAWTSALAPERGGSPYTDAVVPGEGPKTGFWVKAEEGGRVYDKDAPAPIETKVLKPGYRGTPSLAWQSYANLYLWDGAPQHQTGAGFGH